MAERLQQQLPAKLCWHGSAGDVFGILRQHRSILSPEALNNLLRQPLCLEQLQQNLTATIGLACLDQIDGSGSDALKAANIALKHGKQQQRGSINHFTRAMEQATHARVRLLQELREAFEQQQLFLVYQPQVRLQRRPAGLGSRPCCAGATTTAALSPRRSSFRWRKAPG